MFVNYSKTFQAFANIYIYIYIYIYILGKQGILKESYMWKNKYWLEM